MVDGRAVDQEDFELPANVFKAPLGKYFQAWAIGSKDGQQLNAGDRHTFTADTPVYAIWADAPNRIAFFRTGDRETYTVGETVALDARTVDGTAPYDYQFYAIRSKGSEVILRDYAAANAFDWRPQDPDTYTVGVRAMDAEGIVVSQEKTVTVLASTVEPLHIVTFRAGWSDTYKLGQTINLAGRGGGGTGPYKYQFYVLRSNGNRVNFRPAPVSANIYPWTPVTPDTYTLGIDVYDSSGKKVTQMKAIIVLP